MSAIKYPQCAITTGSLFVKQDLSSLWYTVIDITSLWYIIIVFLLQKWGWLLGDTEEKKKNFPLYVCTFPWNYFIGPSRQEVLEKKYDRKGYLSHHYKDGTWLTVLKWQRNRFNKHFWNFLAIINCDKKQKRKNEVKLQ